MKTIENIKKTHIDSHKINSPCEATQSHLRCGAKKWEKGCNSAIADFLLEADKRGTPPKSEKVATFWCVEGAERVAQPFLRTEIDDSKGQSSKSSANLCDLDYLLRAMHFDKNDEKINVSIKRAGFGMMFAIIITILVATLGVLAVKFSTQTLNTTTNEYIAIQLDLYLNSTTELAILYAQRNGFVCKTNSKYCDLGDNQPGGDVRANVMESIEGYMTYGKQNEYSFKYKMTPLDNYNKYDGVYQQVASGDACVEQSGVNGGRCFKEETKNAFVLDISGSVTNPITHQTLRVSKRQIIKP